MNYISVGAKIVYCGNLEDPSTIKEGTVTRYSVPNGLVWIDNHHLAEDCIYTAYCWPARVKNELTAIVTETARLKKELADRMGLIYQLRNRITRGEA